MRKSLIALALLPMLLTSCKDTGSGEKVGSIVKLAKQGVFCQTWEAEMIRGGFSNGSGVGGTPFHFTIEDNPELVKKVEQLMNTQQEIKITYRTELATFCRSDSEINAFLTNIEVLGEDAERPLEVDNSEPTKIVVVSPDDAETREERINKLLEVQQKLIEEIAHK